MIEIVTHCWSGDKVPIYHKLLQLQLSSLIQTPPTIDTAVSICYSESDRKTVEIVNWFRYEKRTTKTLYLKDFILEEKDLFRRAIGRNMAAKESVADVLWFTDCDYLFCDSSTLQLAHHYCLQSEYNMVRPEIVNIHRMHGYGDVLIDQTMEHKPYHVKLDPDHFEPRRERRSIGGIQIVKGAWAKENGYLDGTRWTHQVNPKKGFKSCRCDVPFRKQVGQSVAVDIPGVYRIRHSFCGRDGGTKDHGSKTKNKSRK